MENAWFYHFSIIFEGNCRKTDCELSRQESCDIVWSCEWLMAHARMSEVLISWLILSKRLQSNLKLKGLKNNFEGFKHYFPFVKYMCISVNFDISMVAEHLTVYRFGEMPVTVNKLIFQLVTTWEIVFGSIGGKCLTVLKIIVECIKIGVGVELFGKNRIFFPDVLSKSKGSFGNLRPSVETFINESFLRNSRKKCYPAF